VGHHHGMDNHILGNTNRQNRSRDNKCVRDDARPPALPISNQLKKLIKRNQK
jgi:hypothetical protein